MRKRMFLIIFIMIGVIGCKAISNKTPAYYQKKPHAYRSEAAHNAADFFWQAFQTADYNRSDEALNRLLQVNELDPTDDHMTALAGLCSFWKVVEHGRQGTPASTMEPYAIRSVELVTKAGSLNPTNKLTPGFIASANYQLGAMQNNRDLMNQAIHDFKYNTKKYPQFHGFVEGWVLTAMLPPDHPCYNDAVEAYFKTLDSCAGIRVPRLFPKLGPIGTAVLAKRSACETVCYDTNIAPHNVEGTLLGLGDALVKQGKFRQARIVYESIPSLPAYKDWPYQELLKYRLDNMQTLRDKFVADSGRLDVCEPAMLYQSVISCTGCHATNNPNMRYVSMKVCQTPDTHRCR